MQTRYAKRIGKIRSKTVEPVLGTLINFMNMKRVNTRGIKQVNKHVLMATMCYNLKKYLKANAKNTSTIVVAMTQKIVKNLDAKKITFNPFHDILRTRNLTNGLFKLKTTHPLTFL